MGRLKHCLASNFREEGIVSWSRYSTFSQRHKGGNNGINANFVIPYICHFLHYLNLKMFSKCIIRRQFVKESTFQGCRLLKFWIIIIIYIYFFVCYKNGTPKKKSAILAPLYCGDIVKNSVGILIQTIPPWDVKMWAPLLQCYRSGLFGAGR